MKKCRKCGLEKELEKFTKVKKCTGGRSHVCQACTAAYIRKKWATDPAFRKKRVACHDRWANKNSEYLSAYNINHKRKKNYGVSPEEWSATLEKQENACACCGDVFEEKKPFGDHDHATGKFRGLLCYRCNLALGFALDSVTRLEKLIAYLQKFM